MATLLSEYALGELGGILHAASLAGGGTEGGSNANHAFRKWSPPPLAADNQRAAARRPLHKSTFMSMIFTQQHVIPLAYVYKSKYELFINVGDEMYHESNGSE